MKYVVRAFKSMIYFVLVFVVIVAILYFLLERPKGIGIADMFQEGSLLKLILFFVAFGAIYPAVSFFKRKVFMGNNLAANKDVVVEAMESLDFVLEKEAEGMMTFRQRTVFQRLSRLFGEDRVTITADGNTLTVEGYRKDVMRVVSNISYKLGQDK